MLASENLIEGLTAPLSCEERRGLRIPRHGQGLVEYALVLVLIAVVLILILTFVGNELGSIFSEVGSALGS